MFFSAFSFLEPFLIFFDFLVGISLLVLYHGQPAFAVPLFLATFAAGSVSWGVAFLTALCGTLVFLGESLYRLGLTEEVLTHPSWLLVLVINFALATIGLFKSESLREKERVDSLVSLIEAGQELGSTLTYDRLFKLTFEVVRNLFSATSCAIYLRDAEGFMKVQAVEGPYPKLFHDFDPKVAKSILTQIVNEKAPQAFGDVQILPESEEQILPKAKLIRAGMAVPLVFENESIGVIFVAGSFPNLYGVDLLKLFIILANQTAVSLRNVQLHEKTATMAITDSVSGLYTHGYMQEVLEKEFRRCKYANLPLSAIILDVDHFKIVNDTYGHPQGDALLRQLGAVIKTVTRATDTVCRYGGDEFMIILPETNRIGAVLVAERVRQTVQDYEFVIGSKIVHIGISGGVASFPEDIETRKELVEKADQALYQAKKQGRNKVCFSA